MPMPASYFHFDGVILDRDNWPDLNSVSPRPQFGLPSASVRPSFPFFFSLSPFCLPTKPFGASHRSDPLGPFGPGLQVTVSRNGCVLGSRSALVATKGRIAECQRADMPQHPPMLRGNEGAHGKNQNTKSKSHSQNQLGNQSGPMVLKKLLCKRLGEYVSRVLVRRHVLQFKLALFLVV